MAKKISISIGALQKVFGDKEALRICAEAGLDGVDFSVEKYPQGVLPDIMAMSHDEFVTYFTELKEYADLLGLEIPQTHSLVGAYTPNKEENENLRKRALRDIEATALLGCKYCVIHCISNFEWGHDVDDETMHKENQKMYADFIPTAEKFGVSIAIESFGAVCGDPKMGYEYYADAVKILDEYEALPTKNKAICLDCGHVHNATKDGYPEVDEVVKLYGDRIKILHLHDNDRFMDQHLFPGQGTIAWDKLFAALEKIGYDGYYNFELGLRFAECNPGFVKALVPYLHDFMERPNYFWNVVFGQ